MYPTICGRVAGRSCYARWTRTRGALRFLVEVPVEVPRELEVRPDVLRRQLLRVGRKQRWLLTSAPGFSVLEQVGVDVVEKLHPGGGCC